MHTERHTLLQEETHTPQRERYNELTVLGTAKLVLQLTGSTSVIEYRPLPIDDPKVRHPEIKKARTLLGWEPMVRLKDGLSSTISYFRKELQG